MKKTLLLVILGLIGLTLLVILSAQAEAKVPKCYYTAGTNTITVVDGNVTVPNTMTTIYTRDVALGWGKVTKTGNKQFRINCKITFGNSTSANNTYFVSYKEMIVFEDVVAQTTYSTMRFGNWTNSPINHSYAGSMITFNKTITSTTYYDFYGSLYFYGCIVQSTGYKLYLRARLGATTVYNETLFTRFRGLRFLNSDSMMYGCIEREMIYPVYLDKATIHAWGKNKIYDIGISGDSGVVFTMLPGAAASIILYEPDMGNLAYGNYYILNEQNLGTYILTMEVINPVHKLYGLSTSPLVVMSKNALDGCFVRFNYTMQIKVINSTSGLPIEDAQVRLWNKTGTLYYTGDTDANGNIGTLMLPVLKCYDPNNGVLTDNTFTTKNITYTPYTMVINKTGYQNYSCIFNTTAPINWTISLNETVSAATVFIPLGQSKHRETTFLTIGIFGGMMLAGFLPFELIKRRRKR